MDGNWSAVSNRGVTLKDDHSRDRSKNTDRKFKDMLCEDAEGTSLFGIAFKKEKSVRL